MALKSPRRGIQSIRRHYSAALGSFPSRSFYVDATSGSDANSGTYPDDAWQTVDKVNKGSFFPGDRILFKRGETWAADYLTVPLWALPSPSVTIGAYGTGADPLINGFVPWWTPEDHGNLVEWWDARDLSGTDGSEITTWTGKNANVASQAGAGLKPTLQSTSWVGLPAVRFDGDNDYLATAINPPTPAGTVMVISRPRDVGIASYPTGSRDGASNRFYLRRLANVDTFYFGNPAEILNARFGQSDDTIHHVAFIYDGSDLTLRVNGYQEDTEAQDGVAPATPMYIGCYNLNGAPSGHAEVDVSHVLIFNAALNAATCQQVESYFARQVYLPLHPDVWFAQQWQETLDEWYVGQPPPPSEVTVGLVGTGSEILTKSIQREHVLVTHVPEMDGANARATVARSHEFEDSSRTDLYFSFQFKYLALPTDSTWGPMITQYKSVAPSDPLYFLSWKWPWDGTVGLYRDVFVPPAAGAWMAPAAAIPVPVAGEWMHCEMRYNWNAVGDVQVWLDGVLIWNVAGVDTRHNAGGAAGNFGVGLYGSGIAPADMTMYIKDVHISESQLGP